MMHIQSVESTNGCFVPSSSPPKDVLLEWLGRGNVARIMLAPDGVIVWASKGACKLISRTPGIGTRDDRLIIEDPLVASEFEGFVANLSDRISSIALPLGSDSHLVVHGSIIVDGAKRFACFTLVADGPDFVPTYCDLETVFDLTPTEARVVKCTIVGKNAVQISEHLGISVETVRTHIRRIYSKIGTSSREELLYRLSPYRIL